MKLFTIIEKNTYVDSLATLLKMSLLMDCPGIQSAYVGMATSANKAAMQELSLVNEEILQAKESDLVLAALAESEEAFASAVEKVEQDQPSNQEERLAYNSVKAAVEANPRANICSIAVPGEYACEVTKQALEQGLHCVVLSDNVPIEQELEMKECAREKGLLCMGPDCGVTNINGAAFVLSSINNRGPFGIVGASGCGIQHVAAMLHKMGSGVTQTIGTGGRDLHEKIGGISMLMGIDALEDDEDTKYIIIISRKPADSVLDKVVERIKRCRKPVVACMMGADREKVESSGAVWADNLDDCGRAALAMIGKDYDFDTDEQLQAWAREAVEGMLPAQKYVRGVFSGGTYCDETMKTLKAVIGPINSNCPLTPEERLADSMVSVENTVVDCGEEEFTKGKPHPALAPSVRLPFIGKEGDDPETAVLLMDLILCPPAHIDPASVLAGAISEAMEKAKQRGGKLAVVASVLGTDADFQNVDRQRKELADIGVYVCKTNRQAAQLAAEIVRLKKERDMQNGY